MIASFRFSEGRSIGLSGSTTGGSFRSIRGTGRSGRREKRRIFGINISGRVDTVEPRLQGPRGLRPRRGGSKIVGINLR